MPSLTRAEAEHRSRLVAVDSYDIELDLTRGDTDFGSVTTIRWRGLADGPSFVDVKAAAIGSAQLDGVALPLDLWREGRLPLAVTPGVHELRVEATMRFRRDGSGLHRAVDPADGRAYVYAQSFLDYAPALFACFDQPDLKASISLRVKAPADWVVIGNGAMHQLGDGQWQGAPTPPISTYLVTVCAGPFVAVRAEHDGVPLALHARASLEPQLQRWAAQILEVTGQGFDAYHALFGIRYPFGEYHQVFVPDFNAIAMENPGCVTLRDALLYRGAATPADVQRRSRTVVHELAHMWFGDLVTLRWWDDLWLNESFAEYLAHRVLTGATEFVDSWVDFGILRKTWGYAGERAPTTHPVAGAPARTAADALSDFDGISYAKGATALRQLIGYVGDAPFVAGVRAYLTEHAYGSATFTDFLGAIERAAGRDLQGWAHAWLRTAGRDTLAVDASVTPAVLHVTPAAPGSRPHVCQVAVYTADGQADPVSVRAEGEHTALSGLAVPSASRVVLPNSDDRTWAALHLDEVTLGCLPEVLAQIADPVARSVLWQALDDGVARGVVDPRTYLTAVQRSWPSEGYPALQESIADQSLVVVRRFLPESEADAAYQGLAQVATELLHAAVPASPVATIAARLLARAARHESVLRELLQQPPSRLAVDVDFRWSVLTSLAIGGWLTEAELAAAEQADASVSGRLAALHARAARPTPEAKTWAFEQLTSQSAGRSSHELVELARGLWRSPDPALVRGFVGPYLEAIPRMAAWVGADALTKTVRFGFPWVVEPATIELVDAALTRPDLPTDLRRAYVEWSWPVREALASRARFGGGGAPASP
jgi:aminopeptidase N